MLEHSTFAICFLKDAKELIDASTASLSHIRSNVLEDRLHVFFLTNAPLPYRFPVWTCLRSSKETTKAFICVLDDVSICHVDCEASALPADSSVDANTAFTLNKPSEPGPIRVS